MLQKLILGMHGAYFQGTCVYFIGHNTVHLSATSIKEQEDKAFITLMSHRFLAWSLALFLHFLAHSAALERD